MSDSIQENGAEVDLSNPAYFINRELSTIEFNRRVLLESFKNEHPLLERAKFSAIYSNNMDEFFMVRVSGIKQQVLAGVSNRAADGLTPRELLVQIHKTVAEIVESQMSNWQETLRPRLEEEGIRFHTYSNLSDTLKERLSDYFDEQIFPVLTPLAFDPGHPFPHISNLSLNLAVLIRNPQDGDSHFARVKVPDVIPRLIELHQIDPEMEPGIGPSEYGYIWIEDLITNHLDRLFPGMDVIEAHPFRVTRNTDFELQEDEAEDLLEKMEEVLKQRHFGFVVRLEIDKHIPDKIRELLETNLEIGRNDIYYVDGPLGLNSLFQLMGIEKPHLKDEPYQPVLPPPLRQGENIFSVLRRQDILLHHPFDSFAPVVELVQTAAADPNVLAIKQTLYRVGPKPPIVKALMEARQNGKQVTVLVELKARFDEESNIEWARALENAGVHVVYGLIGLKTHSKCILVVRRERDGIRRYVHMATGNYNASTARLYTDIGLMSSDPDLGADMSDVFNYLTGYSRQTEFRKCLVSPVSFRPKLIEYIEHEATLGREGKIIFKINHLVDPELIQALYRASMAGVQIDLMIRGVCSLRPGLPGISETIRVTSTVGRFLEHTRVFYFHNRGDMRLYAGSADLMQRNLDRRVEVIFPIESDTVRREVMDHLLQIYLMDTRKSYLLQKNGEYLPVAVTYEDKDQLFSAQDWYLNHRETYIQPVGLG